MSELEIYIQEQRENDENLKVIYDQRSKDEEQQNSSQQDSTKVISFLQKMNLKSFESNQQLPSCSIQSASNKHQQSININKSKSQEEFSPSTPKVHTPQITNESNRAKANIVLQQNQDNQTSFFQPSTLIQDQVEYELCKNVLKKAKTERNDKDLSVLQITLGNNLELLQKYKTFLPMKNFKELLYHFEYQECQPFEQILNIESKSNKVYFLLKGEVAIFIPRIENNEQQEESYSPKGKSKEQNDSSPVKIPLRKSQTQLNLQGQMQVLNQNEIQLDLQGKGEAGLTRNQVSRQNDIQVNNPQSQRTFNNILDDENETLDISKIKQNFKQEMEERFQNFKLLKFSKLGDMFGETSLEFRNQEIFSVVCVTNCEFAVMQPAPYYNCLSHKFFLTHLEIDKMFRKTQLFYNWPHYSLYEFSKIAQRHIYGIHDVVFNIGEKIDRIYFLCSGMIHKLQPLSTANDYSSPISKLGGYKISFQTESNFNYYFCKLISEGKEAMDNNLKEQKLNASAFGEEGIIDIHNGIQQKTRTYQAVSKKQDTIVYSIESKLFQEIYYYIVAKEGLDSYEQQQEKKKRKFLDSIYRSIRQMERIQILEKTIDDIKKQRMKQTKRQQLQRQQILNENQLLYAVTNDDLDHIQLNHYLKHELEDQLGDKIQRITNNSAAPKKRSLSSMNGRQKQAYYNVTNFHFTEKELKRFKQMQINKIDQTLNQEIHFKREENNNNQVMIVKNDLIIQPFNTINADHVQQQHVIHQPNNQIPSKKLEQIKYDIIAKHINQQQQQSKMQNTFSSLQNSKNASIIMGSKRQKFSNSDKYNIQKYPPQQQLERSGNKTNLDQLNDQENFSNKFVEFQTGEKKDISMNELNKVEQHNSNHKQTSRLFKMNYNHYKNIVQGVNKTQKVNNFYDGNSNEVDLFKNTSFLFEKNGNEKDQPTNNSAQKMRNQSFEKREYTGQSPKTLLKKTPFQMYKETTDEAKKIVRMRRSQSEKKYEFSIKTKCIEMPNMNNTQFQQNSSLSQSINQSNNNGDQSQKKNMAALSTLINLRILNASASNLNNQQSQLQNQQSQKNTQSQLESSQDFIQRKTSSPVPSYRINQLQSMPETLEDYRAKKILNSPKLHQIDLTMNAQSINKVFKNTLKLKSWQTGKGKHRHTQSQGNQTDLNYPPQQPPFPPPLNQLGGDPMKSLATHIQNFEFYARCKNEKPYNIFDSDSNLLQDFISRPQTAAAVQSIISKKTLIKDLMKQTQLKSYMAVQQQNVSNNNIQF